MLWEEIVFKEHSTLRMLDYLSSQEACWQP